MEQYRQKKGGASNTPPLTNNSRTGESSAFRRYRNYVPLDYIRAEILNFDTEQFVLNNPNLYFTEPINRDSAEITEAKKRTATFKNLVFQYQPKSNRLFLSGSLHVFWNDGKHNYNDFPLNGLLEVLSQLKRFFGIEAHHIYLTQIEWGVNIIPEISTDTILNHCLFHRWKRFENKIDGKEGKYFQAEHKRNYLLKFYNKGLQYNLGYDILRVERKQLRWSKYCQQRKIGQTLHDLMTNNFVDLGEMLKSNWNEVLFFDPLMNASASKIFKYRDPISWENIIKKSRTARKRHFDKLRDHNKNHGGNIQSKIHKSIDCKLKELNGDVFTFYPYTYSGNTLPIEKEPSPKRCLITGFDISMQKEESFLLSHTGLLYYLKNDLHTYQKVKRRFLTQKWRHVETRIQIKEIAHNIRTTFTNNYRRERRRLLSNQNQLNLFTNTLDNIIITHYGI